MNALLESRVQYRVSTTITFTFSDKFRSISIETPLHADDNVIKHQLIGQALQNTLTKKKSLSKKKELEL